MNIDGVVLTTAWILTIIMLMLYVPKNKLKEAQVIFLFKQLLTWITGLTVVELELIEYPVRLFSKANATSFTFEFFIYPAICVVFNLHYPEGKSPAKKFMHYVNFCTAMTIIEVAVEKYTNIIKYLHWNWFTTWITLFLTFYFSRKYYVWFFKLNPSRSRGK